MSIDREMRKAVQNAHLVFRELAAPYICYAATKAAVIQFTRVIALQYARSGIRENSILPGMMNTPMVHAPVSSPLTAAAPKRWSAGVTGNVRWDGWVPAMSRTRLRSSHPT